MVIEYITDGIVYHLQIDVDHFKPGCQAYTQARPEWCYPAECAEVEYRITLLRWDSGDMVSVMTGNDIKIPNDIDKARLDEMVINKLIMVNKNDI